MRCQSRLRPRILGPMAVVGSSDLQNESAVIGHLRLCQDFELFHCTHVGTQRGSWHEESIRYIEKSGY